MKKTFQLIMAIMLGSFCLVSYAEPKATGELGQNKTSCFCEHCAHKLTKSPRNFNGDENSEIVFSESPMRVKGTPIRSGNGFFIFN